MRGMRIRTWGRAPANPALTEPLCRRSHCRSLSLLFISLSSHGASIRTPSPRPCTPAPYTCRRSTNKWTVGDSPRTNHPASNCPIWKDPRVCSGGAQMLERCMFTLPCTAQSPVAAHSSSSLAANRLECSLPPIVLVCGGRDRDLLLHDRPRDGQLKMHTRTVARPRFTNWPWNNSWARLSGSQSWK